MNSGYEKLRRRHGHFQRTAPGLVLRARGDWRAGSLSEASQPIRQPELSLARIETEKQFLSHLLIREKDIGLFRVNLQGSAQLRLKCQQRQAALDEHVVQLTRLRRSQLQSSPTDNHGHVTQLRLLRLPVTLAGCKHRPWTTRTPMTHRPELQAMPRVRARLVALSATARSVSIASW